MTALKNQLMLAACIAFSLAASGACCGELAARLDGVWSCRHEGSVIVLSFDMKNMRAAVNYGSDEVSGDIKIIGEDGDAVKISSSLNGYEESDTLVFSGPDRLGLIPEGHRSQSLHCSRIKTE